MSVQGTVTRVQPASGGEFGQGKYAMGSSGDDTLKDSFSSSPLMGTSVTVDGKYIVDEFQAVLDGKQTANVDFGTVDMDYNEAPTLRMDGAVHSTTPTGTPIKSGKYPDKKGSGQGMPSGPFVPTTASPAGTIEVIQTDAASQPGVAPVKGHNGDLGSIANPNGSTYSFDLHKAYAKGSST